MKIRRIVSDIIGRTSWLNPIKFWSSASLDKTIPNYQFWDSLRRGTADGYALGGLFARPLTEIVAGYVLGDQVTLRVQRGYEDITDDQRDYIDQALSAFMGGFMYDLITLLPDLYALGDQVVVFNADSTISIPSPDTVSVEYNEVDYRLISKVTIKTLLDQYDITDVYTITGRVVTVKYLADVGDIKKNTIETFEYENLTGTIPVIHFANDRSGNETHGRPFYEALLRLFSRYDDLVEKGLDGAELMGNPIPVFLNSQDPEAVTSEYAPSEDEEYTDIDGNTETRDIINWDNRTALVLGLGADFKFAAPGSGFTGDIREMAKLLFLLQLDHTRIPEGVWGGAINYQSGMNEQMKPFYAFVGGRRLMLEGRNWNQIADKPPYGGLLQLGHLFLSFRALTDPKITVVPLEVVWPALDEVDLAMRLQWTSFLREQGLISKVETVTQSGLVEDAQAAVDDADTEKEEEPDNDQFQGQLDAAIQALGQQQQPPTEPEPNE